METIEQAIERFVVAMNNLFDQASPVGCNADRLATDGTRYAIVTVDLTEGQKFARIVTEHPGTTSGQKSVFCFIARDDGSSKALGTYRKGDILKAAGWKAPAKTARGNIFADMPNCGIKTWLGPTYLKGPTF